MLLTDKATVVLQSVKYVNGFTSHLKQTPIEQPYFQSILRTEKVNVNELAHVAGILYDSHVNKENI